jgi:hypothetical protein
MIGIRFLAIAAVASSAYSPPGSVEPVSLIQRLLYRQHGNLVGSPICADALLGQKKNQMSQLHIEHESLRD